MSTTRTRSNTITLEDGIISVVQAGDQTRESILGIVRCVRLLIDELPEVKILVDYSDSGKIDLGAYKTGFFGIKSIKFNKVAIFGASPYMIEMVNAMAMAVGKGDIVHFSRTREAALAWLQK
jgi:hypothetical protein